jgi:hypothetical protein
MPFGKPFTPSFFDGFRDGSNRRLNDNSYERVTLKRDGVATARDWSSKWITLHMLIMDEHPTHTLVTRCETFTGPRTVTPGTPLLSFATNSG